MAKLREGKYTHPALINGLTDEPAEIDAQFEMIYCDDCGGKGKVDIDGLRGSAELDRLLAEDNDFEDAYWNTDIYQQPCPTCKGDKHHEIVVFTSLPKWAQDKIFNWNESERESAEEERQERAVGA